MGKQTVAVIGGGKMGEALLKGISSAKLISKDNIIVAEVIQERSTYLKDTYGISTTSDNREAAKRADIIILAVKPQIVPEVLKKISKEIGENKLVISIAAGITIREIEKPLPKGAKVIRVMPNTPAQVRVGMTAIAPGKFAKSEDVETCKEIFEQVGKVVVVEEKLMDAITAISGCGPAYVCLFIEALAQGGVKMGLTAKEATILAAQTFLGTAKMIIETGKHPAVLKDEVTSPGGATIAGLHVLEKGKIRGIIMEAVEKAAGRSKELGGQKNEK